MPGQDHARWRACHNRSTGQFVEFYTLALPHTFCDLLQGKQSCAKRAVQPLQAMLKRCRTVFRTWAKYAFASGLEPVAPSRWTCRSRTRRLSGEQPNLPAIAVSASCLALIFRAVFHRQTNRTRAELKPPGQSAPRAFLPLKKPPTRWACRLALCVDL